MSDLVGNPEDRFSRVAAHIMHGLVFVMSYLPMLPRLVDITDKNCTSTPMQYQFFFFFFFNFKNGKLIFRRCENELLKVR